MVGRNYFHLHLVSDATGETLIAVSRAAAAQYQGVSSIEHVYPLVRNQAQLDKAIAEIKAAPGIVLYTLVDASLSAQLEAACEESSCPSLSVLEPILGLFQSYLGTASTPRPGAQHMLNSDYFKRIDALNFTMLHDDGQLPEQLDDADVVLLGVSRTSKTPTSIYLANRGIKTANIPIVPNVPLPAALGFFTGLADFARRGDTWSLFGVPGFAGARTIKRGERHDSPYVGAHDRHDPALSPIYADLSGFPPTLCVAGTRDMMLSDTSRFHRALLRAGVDADLVVFDALPHAHWYMVGIPEAQEANELMARYFLYALS